MPFAYTQNIKPTPEQIKKIQEIFTPEYIIETSKVISIVKEQDSVIAARDVQVKELESKILRLKAEYTKTLDDIRKENKIAKTSSEEEDKLSDDIIKSKTFGWKGIHLYVGTEVPKLSFQNLSFNSELMIEFNKFNVGLKAEFSDIRLRNDYDFNYFIKIRYKIF